MRRHITDGHKVKKWCRLAFVDGSFIYLPFRFSSLTSALNEVKLHGRIIAIRKMENRL